VPGVGDELALTGPGVVERLQHLVERGGQPGDLVVALDGDRLEPLGAGDGLDCAGEPAHGTQAVGRDRPPGHGGGDDAGEAEQDADEAELGQHLLLRVQRLREHEGLAVLTGRHRDHPEALVTGLDGAQRVVGRAQRDRELLVAEGDLGVVGAVGRQDRRVVVEVDEGDADVTGTQRPRRDVGAHVVGQRRLGRRLLGPLEQRGVQAALQLQTGGDERTERDERDGDAHRDRGEQRDPAGQRAAVVPAGRRLAHDSLST
jgi:hypothetical protein